MKHLAFILSMPNRGSWNGEWSGDGRNYSYVKTRSFRKAENPPEEKVYFFRWDDGWGANVKVREVTAKEAARLRKQTAGFCGYEWMIESIIKHGEIRQTVV